MLRIFLSFLILATAQFSFGQRYSFVSYSLEQGLPQSQVTSITEDDNGYLWVGTLGGLARYNGVRFVNFSRENGLFNNRITSLDFTHSELWIGHEGGVSVYANGKISNWSLGERFKNVSVSSITWFQNTLVIATNGEGLFFLKNGAISHLTLSNPDQNRVRDLLVFNNHLYVATRDGLIRSKDLNFFPKVSDAGQTFNISGLTTFRGAMYFTTFDTGIFQFSPDTKTSTLVSKSPEDMALRGCFMARDGKIWSYSRQGIWISSKYEQKKIDASNGLPLNSIGAVYQDRNGTFWFGSEGNGLIRFPGEQFVHFKLENGIPSELIIASYRQKNGVFWFGSYDKGLISYRKSSNTFSNFDIPNNTVWAIHPSRQGGLWLGTEAGLIHWLNGKSTIYDESKGSPGIKVTAFFEDTDGLIWAAGSNGLSLITNGNVIHKVSLADQQDEIGTIRSIRRWNGKLICAADGGLFVYANGRFSPYLGLKKTVFSIDVDKYNRLWIGTDNGLYYVQGKGLSSIPLSKQPAANFVNFIRCSQDRIFIGTNHGLFSLTVTQRIADQELRRYGIEDGMINLESNINSSWFDQQGNLWFGTASGLSCFQSRMEAQTMRSSRPHLNWDGMKINFQDSLATKYATAFDPLGFPSKLVLPFNMNNLMLELDGIALKDAKQLQYQYFLAGMDERWSPFLSSPQLTLSNLPSGDYTLMVRAIGPNGLLSNQLSLTISITPAFYRTWWFYSLIVITVIASIILAFQVRIRRERAKNYRERLEFKSRLLTLEQQSLNASMNRHFIFNSLNSIQYFINTQDRLSANRYLTNFAKLIRKNLDSSSEDNNMVPLSEEIERLELYLSLESMRFRGRFEYEIDVDVVEDDQILVPAMLLQPFVENSIIHGILPNESKLGFIRVHVEKVGSRLEITIEDNGVGIEESMKKKRSAQGDHKSQGMEITGKRFELLRKLSDQNFELEGPRQRYADDRSINGTYVCLKIPLGNLEDEN